MIATANSGLPVTFQLLSGPAHLSGDTLTIISAGTILVRAMQAGNAIYLPVTLDRQFTVMPKASQSIQFATLADVPVTTSSINLEATASSGLPVAFTLVTGDASLTGTTLTIKGAGQITVRASQPGNNQFDPAPDIERSFAVTRLPQIITLAELPVLRFGDSGAKLAATASSGLAVSFQLLSGSAELTDALLKPISPGSVAIRASQSGNETWLPASDVDLTLTIAKAVQTITFPPPGERLTYDSRVHLTASASSGLPVTFHVISGPGELSGDVLYANGLGEIIVEASQTGDANYETATIPQTISVLGSPGVSVGIENGKLLLTWPDNYTGFQLESATSLNGPWTPFTFPNASQNQNEITMDSEARFFRLKAN